MQEKYVISHDSKVKDALGSLNVLAKEENHVLTLFVINGNGKRVVGTITDGDIRRGLLGGVALEDNVKDVMNEEFKCLISGTFDFKDIDDIKSKGIRLVPIVNEERELIKVVDFEHSKSILPVDAVIMAGGEGKRLRPMTLDTPKPLLKVGGKPIIEYNVERLQKFGVGQITISLRYLGEMIEDYFTKKGQSEINYVYENAVLGTIGAVSMIERFDNEYVLVMNSDLLTDIDFEDFVRSAIEQEADMVVAAIPHRVNIPYAVLETSGEEIVDFKEKPTYTYYSNAGIYLIKRELLSLIPKEKEYNTTDLMDHLIKDGKKVCYYNITGYWLDIGKPDDFKKAQLDIQSLHL